MPSLVPGFTYDIFISYRHHDNNDGWVTDFVGALEKELRTVIKEPVNVYFDRNPADGLLETHQVEKSLETKLQSALLVPILSQTYCDTHSYAWQNEFCAFNREALQSETGRDIRLAHGNVSSRLLPVRIHDLDADDTRLLEQETGGPLRAIDFTYREPGVNRPLKPDDRADKNLNQTIYRNQVNKMALAIKEALYAMKRGDVREASATAAPAPVPTQKRSFAWAIITAVVLAGIATGWAWYASRPVAVPTAKKIDKSIAVLPFADLSEKQDRGWFADGLTEEILNSLAHVDSLSVISRTSSFAFKDKNLPIQKIADSLHVNYVVEGSVRTSGEGVRITAQLIRAADGFHLWSQTYDRETKDILVLQQEIATRIAENLDLTLDPATMQTMEVVGTRDAEAFLAFLRGNEYEDKAHAVPDRYDGPMFLEANKHYDEATRRDPHFATPYLYLADYPTHYLMGDLEDAGLKPEAAYQQLMDYLGNAVKQSRNDTQREYYRMYEIMFSRDWSSFDEVIRKNLANPGAYQYFEFQSFNLNQMLACLGFSKEVAGINHKVLRRDPLNPSANMAQVVHPMFTGAYPRVLEVLDSLERTYHDPLLKRMRIHALLFMGKVEDAENYLATHDSTQVRSWRELKAITLMKKGQPDAAKSMLRYKGQVGFKDTLFGIDAVLGREAANREAARLDKLMVMDFHLFLSYVLSPSHPPFDLDAVPNFERRFKQAGVDLRARLR